MKQIFQQIKYVDLSQFSEILTDLVKKKGGNQSEIARQLGISSQLLGQYVSGRHEPKPAFYVKWKKVFGEDLMNLTETNVSRNTFAEEHEPSYQEKRLEGKNNIRRKTIPFYDAPAAAGLTETEMTAIHAPAGTIDIGDLLSDSQAAIRIYGNSMLPNYPPGCVVGLAKCDSLMIEPGEVYVIETRTRRILKRLFYPKDKSESDKVTCYSDNTMKFDGGARHGMLAYPPYDLPKKEIINLFVVTGVIKRNANSVIINR